MSDFEIQISSVPDRENLVAEIWLGDNLICEVNNEGDRLEIEFFTDVVKKFDYLKFLRSLERAKSKLLMTEEE